MSLSKQVILKDMNLKFEMKGSVNGHYFEIEGEGKGKPYEGVQKSTFWVTKGGPLPFSFDILSTVFKYGNRCFTKYPADMPDYFKQAFPAGMSFERAFTYEDGGDATASGHICLEGNLFKHISMFHGVNFPANGPIMQKRTIGWDPSFQKMTVSNNILRGDVTMFLQLKGGGYHSCQFHTSYKTKEPVTMPQNHVVEHHIVRTDIEDKKVLLEETAVAHVNPL